MTNTLNYSPDLDPSSQEFFPSGNTYEAPIQPPEAFASADNLQNSYPQGAEQLGRLANQQAATELKAMAIPPAPEAIKSVDQMHRDGVASDSVSIMRVREAEGLRQDYELAA